MILCREAILNELEMGNIVIDPFVPELVNPNSVNFRLGADLWELDGIHTHTPPHVPYRDIYAPRKSIWNKIAPKRASIIRLQLGDPNWAAGIVPDDAMAFILRPGQFYLATTLEKIGTRLPKASARSRDAIIPKIHSRSTFRRLGLELCSDAGFGDVGYHSRWALEIRVDGKTIVPIAVGTPIGQVEFSYGTPTSFQYGGEGSYQEGDDVNFLPKGLGWVDPDA